MHILNNLSFTIVAYTLKKRKMYMKNIAYLSVILALVFMGSCTDELENKGRVVSDEEKGVDLQFTSLQAANITSGIRVFGFEENNLFVSENPTVALADTSLKQRMSLPVTTTGQDKIVLVANAGSKGTQTPFISTFQPYVLSYTDVMFSLVDVGFGLPEPTQYYYGNKSFPLSVTAPVPEYTIYMNNLCSRTVVDFVDEYPGSIDSVQVWIDNVGKSIRFDGTTSAVGTTEKYGFYPMLGDTLAKDSFLVFPSQLSTKPIINALFYLKSGSIKQFKKTLTYDFVSNKVLDFTFDLTNVKDTMDLTVVMKDWDGTVMQTMGSSLNLGMKLNGGYAPNYTKADITLSNAFTNTISYPIIYEQLPVNAIGVDSLNLSIPIGNTELGSYKITNILLYDEDGSFEALIDTMSFEMQLNLNVISAPVYGRTGYDNYVFKRLMQTVDGSSGSVYPGTSIMTQIITNPTYNVFTNLGVFGLSQATVRNENRLSAWNIPSSYSTLSTVNIDSMGAMLTQMIQFGLPPTQVRTIDLRNLPKLSSIYLGANLMIDINLAGLKSLSSFTSGFTTADLLALRTVNISGTNITMLPIGATAITSLYWSACNITDVLLNASKPQLLAMTGIKLLDLSNNKLTSYPALSSLAAAGLTSYNVSGNSIVSCALVWMKPFGEINIIPQRTGFNWWCP